MKLTQIIADIICKTLMDPKVLDNARRRKGAFTRNCKKLPFWTVIKLLMSNIKKSISATLPNLKKYVIPMTLRNCAKITCAVCSGFFFAGKEENVAIPRYGEAF